MNIRLKFYNFESQITTFKALLCVTLYAGLALCEYIHVCMYARAGVYICVVS